MALKGGYMGLCVVDGLKVRVTDFNVNVRQEVQFYDHIIGLRDSFPQGLLTKGDVGAENPETNEINIQKYFWRPGVKICSGGFSFPATVANLQKVYDLARTGDDFTLKFTYACDDVQRTFFNCKINSFSFSVSAGEVATIQVDVMGRNMTEDTGSNNYDGSEKLLTWDAINITSNSVHPVQLFNFTVNNSVMPIYTAGDNKDLLLFPQALRVGMQQVTGTIVYYIKGVGYEDLDKDTTFDTIKILIEDRCEEDFEETLCVIYKPIERASSLRALLHTLPFVGVGQAMGKVPTPTP
jgi:hypothetical protein